MKFRRTGTDKGSERPPLLHEGPLVRGQTLSIRKLNLDEPRFRRAVPFQKVVRAGRKTWAAAKCIIVQRGSIINL